MLQPGNQFPQFSLPDQDGATRSNAEFAGKPYVVYFYPKDDTSGCTVEACEFNESIKDFGDTPIVGVSPDSVKSHRKFADKFSLGFTLLADEDKSLAQACGVWVEKSMYGKSYMGVERTTFLVDADGTIKEVWNKVKPKGHAATVRAAIE
jgi:peroxiredoxin Q/BCP